MKSVTIILPFEYICSDAVGIMDILSKVNAYPEFKKREESLFKLTFAGLKKGPLGAYNNISILCDKTIQEISHSDLIIVPSIELTNLQKVLQKNDPYISWIKKLYENGKTEIIGISTGAFLLGKTGLLDNKNCTTSWLVNKKFSQLFPDTKLVSKALFVEVDGIYTCRGGTALIHLIFYIIEKYAQKRVAQWTAKVLRLNYHDIKPYASPFHPSYVHDDEQIKAAQLYIKNNYDNELSVENIAKQTAISTRNFIRRFKKATHQTPIKYIQQIKIEAAKEQLENTNKTVNEVLYSVGYNDKKTFRNLFKRITGLTPTDYRKKYQSPTLI